MGVDLWFPWTKCLLIFDSLVETKPPFMGVGFGSPGLCLLIFDSLVETKPPFMGVGCGSPGPSASSSLTPRLKPSHPSWVWVVAPLGQVPPHL